MTSKNKLNDSVAAVTSSHARCSMGMGTAAVFMAFAAAFVLSTPGGQAAENQAEAAPAANATGDGDTVKKSSEQNILLSAMAEELNRSMSELKNAGAAPLYFLSYAVYDTQTINLQSDYGGSYTEGPLDRERKLAVQVRVGDPRLDNTHRMRGRSSGLAGLFGQLEDTETFPLDDNKDAIRTALWLRTDEAFKDAQQRYRRVKTNRNVRAKEEDLSDDFSVGDKSRQDLQKPGADLKIDRAIWDARLKKASLIYRQNPDVEDSNVTVNASLTRRYFVNSEGTRVEDESRLYWLSSWVSAIAPNGQRIYIWDTASVPSEGALPDEKTFEATCRRLSKDLSRLKAAPQATPYSAPAILTNRAAGVFFHEVLGHRIEGHHQKDEGGGRTFAQKIGLSIMPSFISVADDPTRKNSGKLQLTGTYQTDAEGVAAQKVEIVKNGVLKSFLMSRSPVDGFAKSNGHARSTPDKTPAARQSNMVVTSSKAVPAAKLRAMLVAEIKNQHKAYGFILDDIAVDSNATDAGSPQSFRLIAEKAYRVFADGRPDELIRGGELVGTPLTSLERIICSGDDDAAINTFCDGASGENLPVSTTSPSILMKTVEIERQEKDQNKAPLLPAPLFDKNAAIKAEVKK